MEPYNSPNTKGILSSNYVAAECHLSYLFDTLGPLKVSRKVANISPNGGTKFQTLDSSAAQHQIM
jgi:hypothetical protein